MSEQTAKCPVCGVGINAALIPAVRNAPFPCIRCRAQLEVAASNPVPILAVGLFLSIILSFTFGLRGSVLFPAIGGGTVIFYWFGQILKSFLITPKLEKSRAGLKLHAANLLLRDLLGSGDKRSNRS